MSNLVLQLGEMAKSVGLKSVYGDPVTVEGVTILPVALVYYGFGGGSDAPDEADGPAAGGGGGGGVAIPVGAYIDDVDGMRFRPNTIALLAVSIPVICVAGRALARVIRALKR